MIGDLWTLAQLPDQVSAVLADNYDGQRSGRIRELPNERTIRWYTTIGLVDRPAAARGRTVLYGLRHVLQLAAVKKLQAEGHSLAEIQQQLVGASNRELARLVGPPAVDIVRSGGSAPTGDFWKHGGGRPTIAEATASGDNTVIDPENTVNHVRSIVPSVRLGDSVTIVLGAASRMPDADELAAIEAAAAPLLELLGRLGLMAPTTETPMTERGRR